MRRPATTVREGQAPNAQPPIPTHATDPLPWRITDIVSMLVLSARGNLYAKPIRNYLTQESTLTDFDRKGGKW